MNDIYHLSNIGISMSSNPLNRSLFMLVNYSVNKSDIGLIYFPALC